MTGAEIFGSGFGILGLFVPASSPRMIGAALALNPETVIFDLEDGVSLSEKDSARDLLAGALPLFAGRNVAVRVNGFGSGGEEDLALAADPAVRMVIIPKALPEAVARADRILNELGSRAGLAALIETALSLEKIPETAAASPRVRSLLLGAEDYTLDLGVERTGEGREIFYARARLGHLAHALGLEAVDTPFPGLGEPEAVERDALTAKSLGFTGKLAISPHHLEPIRRVFLPGEQEAAWARRVVEAMADPANAGRGAVALDGRMIDRPILKRAERTLALFQARGERI